MTTKKPAKHLAKNNKSALKKKSAVVSAVDADSQQLVAADHREHLLQASSTVDEQKPQSVAEGEGGGHADSSPLVVGDVVAQNDYQAVAGADVQFDAEVAGAAGAGGDAAGAGAAAAAGAGALPSVAVMEAAQIMGAMIGGAAIGGAAAVAAAAGGGGSSPAPAPVKDIADFGDFCAAADHSTANPLQISAGNINLDVTGGFARPLNPVSFSYVADHTYATRSAFASGNIATYKVKGMGLDIDLNGNVIAQTANVNVSASSILGSGDANSSHAIWMHHVEILSEGTGNVGTTIDAHINVTADSNANSSHPGLLADTEVGICDAVIDIGNTTVTNSANGDIQVNANAVAGNASVGGVGHADVIIGNLYVHAEAGKVGSVDGSAFAKADFRATANATESSNARATSSIKVGNPAGAGDIHVEATATHAHASITAIMALADGGNAHASVDLKDLYVNATDPNGDAHALVGTVSAYAESIGSANITVGDLHVNAQASYTADASVGAVNANALDNAEAMVALGNIGVSASANSSGSAYANQNGLVADASGNQADAQIHLGNINVSATAGLDATASMEGVYATADGSSAIANVTVGDITSHANGGTYAYADVDAVRASASSSGQASITGGKIEVTATSSGDATAYVGEIKADAQENGTATIHLGDVTVTANGGAEASASAYQGDVWALANGIWADAEIHLGNINLSATAGLEGNAVLEGIAAVATGSIAQAHIEQAVGQNIGIYANATDFAIANIDQGVGAYASGSELAAATISLGDLTIQANASVGANAGIQGVNTSINSHSLDYAIGAFALGGASASVELGNVTISAIAETDAFAGIYGNIVAVASIGADASVNAGNIHVSAEASYALAIEGGVNASAYQGYWGDSGIANAQVNLHDIDVIATAAGDSSSYAGAYLGSVGAYASGYHVNAQVAVGDIEVKAISDGEAYVTMVGLDASANAWDYSYTGDAVVTAGNITVQASGDTYAYVDLGSIHDFANLSDQASITAGNVLVTATSSGDAIANVGEIKADAQENASATIHLGDVTVTANGGAEASASAYQDDVWALANGSWADAQIHLGNINVSATAGLDATASMEGVYATADGSSAIANVTVGDITSHANGGTYAYADVDAVRASASSSGQASITGGKIEVTATSSGDATADVGEIKADAQENGSATIHLGDVTVTANGGAEASASAYQGDVYADASGNQADAQIHLGNINVSATAGLDAAAEMEGVYADASGSQAVANVTLGELNVTANATVDSYADAHVNAITAYAAGTSAQAHVTQATGADVNVQASAVDGVAYAGINEIGAFASGSEVAAATVKLGEVTIHAAGSGYADANIAGISTSVDSHSVDYAIGAYAAGGANATIELGNVNVSATASSAYAAINNQIVAEASGDAHASLTAGNIDVSALGSNATAYVSEIHAAAYSDASATIHLGNVTVTANAGADGSASASQDAVYADARGNQADAQIHLGNIDVSAAAGLSASANMEGVYATADGSSAIANVTVGDITSHANGGTYAYADVDAVRASASSSGQASITGGKIDIKANAEIGSAVSASSYYGIGAATASLNGIHAHADDSGISDIKLGNIDITANADISQNDNLINGVYAGDAFADLAYGINAYATNNGSADISLGNLNVVANVELATEVVASAEFVGHAEANIAGISATASYNSIANIQIQNINLTAKTTIGDGDLLYASTAAVADANLGAVNANVYADNGEADIHIGNVNVLAETHVGLGVSVSAENAAAAFAHMGSVVADASSKAANSLISIGNINIDANVDLAGGHDHLSVMAAGYAGAFQSGVQASSVRYGDLSGTLQYANVEIGNISVDASATLGLNVTADASYGVAGAQAYQSQIQATATNDARASIVIENIDIQSSVKINSHDDLTGGYVGWAEASQNGIEALASGEDARSTVTISSLDVNANVTVSSHESIHAGVDAVVADAHAGQILAEANGSSDATVVIGDININASESIGANVIITEVGTGDFHSQSAVATLASIEASADGASTANVSLGDIDVAAVAGKEAIANIGEIYANANEDANAEIYLGNLTVTANAGADGSASAYQGAVWASASGNHANAEIHLGNINVSATAGLDATANMNGVYADASGSHAIANVTMGEINITANATADSYADASVSGITAYAVGLSAQAHVSQATGANVNVEATAATGDAYAQVGYIGAFASGNVAAVAEVKLGDINIHAIGAEYAQAEFTGIAGSVDLYPIDYAIGAYAEGHANATIVMGNVNVSATASSAYAGIDRPIVAEASGNAHASLTVGDIDVTALGANASAYAYVSEISAVASLDAGATINLGNVTVTATGGEDATASIDAIHAYADGNHADAEVQIDDLHVNALNVNNHSDSEANAYVGILSGYASGTNATANITVGEIQIGADSNHDANAKFEGIAAIASGLSAQAHVNMRSGDSIIVTANAHHTAIAEVDGGFGAFASGGANADATVHLNDLTIRASGNEYASAEIAGASYYSTSYAIGALAAGEANASIVLGNVQVSASAWSAHAGINEVIGAVGLGDGQADVVIGNVNVFVGAGYTAEAVIDGINASARGSYSEITDGSANAVVNIGNVDVKAYASGYAEHGTYNDLAHAVASISNSMTAFANGFGHAAINLDNLNVVAHAIFTWDSVGAAEVAVADAYLTKFEVHAEQQAQASLNISGDLQVVANVNIADGIYSYSGNVHSGWGVHASGITIASASAYQNGIHALASETGIANINLHDVEVAANVTIGQLSEAELQGDVVANAYANQSGIWAQAYTDGSANISAGNVNVLATVNVGNNVSMGGEDVAVAKAYQGSDGVRGGGFTDGTFYDSGNQHVSLTLGNIDVESSVNLGNADIISHEAQNVLVAEAQLYNLYAEGYGTGDSASLTVGDVKVHAEVALGSTAYVDIISPTIDAKIDVASASMGYVEGYAYGGGSNINVSIGNIDVSATAYIAHAHMSGGWADAYDFSNVDQTNVTIGNLDVSAHGIHEANAQVGYFDAYATGSGVANFQQAQATDHVHVTSIATSGSASAELGDFEAHAFENGDATLMMGNVAIEANANGEAYAQLDSITANAEEAGHANIVLGNIQISATGDSAGAYLSRIYDQAYTSGMANITVGNINIEAQGNVSAVAHMSVISAYARGGEALIQQTSVADHINVSAFANATPFAHASASVRDVMAYGEDHGSATINLNDLNIVAQGKDGASAEFTGSWTRYDSIEHNYGIAAIAYQESDANVNLSNLDITANAHTGDVYAGIDYQIAANAMGENESGGVASITIGNINISATGGVTSEANIHGLNAMAIGGHGFGEGVYRTATTATKYGNIEVGEGNANVTISQSFVWNSDGGHGYNSNYANIDIGNVVIRATGTNYAYAGITKSANFTGSSNAIGAYARDNSHSNISIGNLELSATANIATAEIQGIMASATRLADATISIGNVSIEATGPVATAKLGGIYAAGIGHTYTTFTAHAAGHRTFSYTASGALNAIHTTHGAVSEHTYVYWGTAAGQVSIGNLSIEADAAIAANVTVASSTAAIASASLSYTVEAYAAESGHGNITIGHVDIEANAELGNHVVINGAGQIASANARMAEIYATANAATTGTQAHEAVANIQIGDITIMANAEIGAHDVINTSENSANIGNVVYHSHSVASTVGVAYATQNGVYATADGNAMAEVSLGNVNVTASVVVGSHLQATVNSLAYASASMNEIEANASGNGQANVSISSINLEAEATIGANAAIAAGTDSLNHLFSGYAAYAYANHGDIVAVANEHGIADVTIGDVNINSDVNVGANTAIDPVTSYRFDTSEGVNTSDFVNVVPAQYVAYAEASQGGLTASAYGNSHVNIEIANISISSNVSISDHFEASGNYVAYASAGIGAISSTARTDGSANIILGNIEVRSNVSIADGAVIQVGNAGGYASAYMDDLSAAADGSSAKANITIGDINLSANLEIGSNVTIEPVVHTTVTGTANNYHQHTVTNVAQHVADAGAFMNSVESHAETGDSIANDHVADVNVNASVHILNNATLNGHTVATASAYMYRVDAYGYVDGHADTQVGNINIDASVTVGSNADIYARGGLDAYATLETVEAYAHHSAQANVSVGDITINADESVGANASLSFGNYHPATTRYTTQHAKAYFSGVYISATYASHANIQIGNVALSAQGVDASASMVNYVGNGGVYTLFGVSDDVYGSSAGNIVIANVDIQAIGGDNAVARLADIRAYAESSAQAHITLNGSHVNITANATLDEGNAAFSGVMASVNGSANAAATISLGDINLSATGHDAVAKMVGGAAVVPLTDSYIYTGTATMAIYANADGGNASINIGNIHVTAAGGSAASAYVGEIEAYASDTGHATVQVGDIHITASSENDPYAGLGDMTAKAEESGTASLTIGNIDVSVTTGVSATASVGHLWASAYNSTATANLMIGNVDVVAHGGRAVAEVADIWASATASGQAHINQAAIADHISISATATTGDAYAHLGGVIAYGEDNGIATVQLGDIHIKASGMMTATAEINSQGIHVYGIGTVSAGIGAYADWEANVSVSVGNIDLIATGHANVTASINAPILAFANTYDGNTASAMATITIGNVDLEATGGTDSYAKIAGIIGIGRGGNTVTRTNSYTNDGSGYYSSGYTEYRNYGDASAFIHLGNVTIHASGENAYAGISASETLWGYGYAIGAAALDNGQVDVSLNNVIVTANATVVASAYVDSILAVATHNAIANVTIGNITIEATGVDANVYLGLLGAEALGASYHQASHYHHVTTIDFAVQSYWTYDTLDGHAVANVNVGDIDLTATAMGKAGVANVVLEGIGASATGSGQAAMTVGNVTIASSGNTAWAIAGGFEASAYENASASLTLGNVNIHATGAELQHAEVFNGFVAYAETGAQAHLQQALGDNISIVASAESGTAEARIYNSYYFYAIGADADGANVEATLSLGNINVDANGGIYAHASITSHSDYAIYAGADAGSSNASVTLGDINLAANVNVGSGTTITNFFVGASANMAIIEAYNDGSGHVDLNIGNIDVTANVQIGGNLEINAVFAGVAHASLQTLNFSNHASGNLDVTIGNISVEANVHVGNNVNLHAYASGSALAAQATLSRVSVNADSGDANVTIGNIDLGASESHGSGFVISGNVTLDSQDYANAYFQGLSDHAKNSGVANLDVASVNVHATGYFASLSIPDNLAEAFNDGIANVDIKGDYDLEAYGQNTARATLKYMQAYATSSGSAVYNVMGTINVSAEASNAYASARFTAQAYEGATASVNVHDVNIHATGVNFASAYMNVLAGTEPNEGLGSAGNITIGNVDLTGSANSEGSDLVTLGIFANSYSSANAGNVTVGDVTLESNAGTTASVNNVANVPHANGGFVVNDTYGLININEYLRIDDVANAHITVGNIDFELNGTGTQIGIIDIGQGSNVGLNNVEKTVNGTAYLSDRSHDSVDNIDIGNVNIVASGANASVDAYINHVGYEFDRTLTLSGGGNINVDLNNSYAHDNYGTLSNAVSLDHGSLNVFGLIDIGAGNANVDINWFNNDGNWLDNFTDGVAITDWNNLLGSSGGNIDVGTGTIDQGILTVIDDTVGDTHLNLSFNEQLATLGSNLYQFNTPGTADNSLTDLLSNLESHLGSSVSGNVFAEGIFHDSGNVEINGQSFTGNVEVIEYNGSSTVHQVTSIVMIELHDGTTVALHSGV